MKKNFETKNIFCDFHHSSLLQSLILLFERRLGGQVYRPIGMEWAEKGFWKVYDHPATQAQYLGIGGATPDGTPRLNDPLYDQEFSEDAIETFLCRDIDSGFFNKAITFEGFMSRKFDIVIASLPQHIEPYKRLCELHPNKPKLIYQIGNAWNIPEGSTVKNVMASAIVPNVSAGINYVQYHQEFDLDIFYAGFVDKLSSPKIVSSFVNCFNIADYMREDWQLFTDVEKAMSEWTFKCYGGQCRDGAAHGSKQLADKMCEARFIWHTKPGGDGYGHVVYNSAAVGRPLIVKKQYYAGKMAEELMIDGVTCIAIDNLSPTQIVEKIQHYSQIDEYTKMCQAVYNNFKNVVNFDQEEVKIRQFLDNLQ